MKLKLLITLIATTLVFTTILFIAAGRIDYLQGWLFLTINIISTILTFLMTGNNAALMKERSKAGEGAKAWDKNILAVSTVMYIAFLIISGLDTGRFGWSQAVHPAIYIIGGILIIGGQAFFLKAKRENNFFSSVVRIQTDRGHTVCDTGVYRIVRHPGYLGMIISNLGLPLITASHWSAIPIFISIILLLIRTYLEDQTLKKELDGYIEYAQKTKKRIIPGVW